MKTNKTSKIDCQKSGRHSSATIGGDVGAIIAEMDALHALFELAHAKAQEKSLVIKARELAERAINMRARDKSFDDKLTTFCLAHVIGKHLHIPKRPHSSRWIRKSFDKILVGWMTWISTGDSQVIQKALKEMDATNEGQSDNTIDVLALQYWTQALELLIQGKKVEARGYFERAVEVGSQFGLSLNPPMSWVYATSFWPAA